MMTGLAPPTAIIGVHCALDMTPTGLDGRAQEYVPGENRRRFRAHLAFVVDEVVPWARRELGVRGQAWTAAGSSNGAVWAIAAAARRPDVFPRVVALSPGVHPRRISRRARSAGVRHYLAAGALEPLFLRSAQKWTDHLLRALARRAVREVPRRPRRPVVATARRGRALLDPRRAYRIQ
jgi:enterochelin esterase-like enzyme